MSEITPTYYASGQANRTFVVTGNYFSNLPKNAIGVMSTKNDEPLRFRYDERDLVTAAITIVSDNELHADNGLHQYADPVYLGGILSADRKIVYWVNDTHPLP